MNNVMIPVLCLSLLSMSACRYEKTMETQKTPVTQEARRMVGELERLGKNGEDFLVLGVDAPGFDPLSQRQKALIYYLYRAAIAGHVIADDQNHRYAVEIRNMLEEIYRHSDGMDEKTKLAVHDYLKYIWINHGPYDHDSHVKTLPNYLTRETLKPGDHVIITGNPGRNPEDHRLRMRTITRPSDGWKWGGTFD